MQIHLELTKRDFELNFDGIRFLRPKKHYIGVQYPPELRQKLKFAKGESGWGTVLALEPEIDPVSILRIYPTSNDSEWYIALFVPRRKEVYGFNKTVNVGYVPQLMTNLRASDFYGPDLKEAQFYIKDATGFWGQIPYLTQLWREPFYIYEEPGKLRATYCPSIEEFISDASPGVQFYDGTSEQKEPTRTPWLEQQAFTDLRAIVKSPLERDLLDAYVKATEEGRYRAAAQAKQELMIELTKRQERDRLFEDSRIPPLTYVTYAAGPAYAAGETYAAGAWPGIRQPKSWRAEPAPVVSSKNGRMIRLASEPEPEPEADAAAQETQEAKNQNP